MITDDQLKDSVDMVMHHYYQGAMDCCTSFNSMLDKLQDAGHVTINQMKVLVDEFKSNIEKDMKNMAFELARKIMKKLYEQTNLAEIAKEYGITAQQTGYFAMLEEIPDLGINFPFQKVAFELNPGEISEIIKTPTAYYILKPIDKKPPHIPDYEEV